MCSRIKYFFLSVEEGDLIDTETGIYGSLHIGRLLASLVEQHRRYGTCFSAATLTLDPEALRKTGLVGRSGKSVMHDLAAAMRSDVRAVDEVGRMSPDALLVLFPSTPPSGGHVAVERLTRTARAMLSRRGAPEDMDILKVEVLGYPDNPEGVVALVEQLTGESFVLPESGAAVAAGGQS
jgi:GGDEF domain-containing protein